MATATSVENTLPYKVLLAVTLILTLPTVGKEISVLSSGSKILAKKVIYLGFRGKLLVVVPGVCSPTLCRMISGNLAKFWIPL